ncbi:hypothetical protein SFIMM107S_03431 [Streptomyces griseus]
MGDEDQPMVLRLRDEQPVEGLGADHRQPPGPHPVRGGEGETRKGDVAYALGQAARLLQQPEVLADTYRDYIALESMAGSIRTFQAQLVPGLLQTPDYIRAVTMASRQGQTADEIEKFVQVRLARQERLLGDTPLQLWAVLSGAVLLQQVGGAQVMNAQLQHLLACSQRPNVTVQVLPFSHGLMRVCSART